MNASPGQTLGRFTLGDRLASTGLATLYMAEERGSSRRVVVKLFRAYFSDEPDLLNEYFEQVERIARLDHPHILAALATGRGDEPWVATEFMAGGSLKDRIGQPITLAEVDRIASHVAAGLDAAHAAGVRHWNIKPSNVMVDADGSYRLADFGMAVLGRGAHALIRSASTTPLPTYMPAEQTLEMTLSERSDVYSLGVLLYHLLTGQAPYVGADPAAVWAKQLAGPPERPDAIEPAIPASVSDVVLAALVSNPEKRYASGGELAQAFHQAVEEAASSGVEILARPEPAPAPPETPAAARDTGERVHCHVCGGLNPPGATHCGSCWSNLEQAVVVDERDLLERLELQRKTDLLARTVGIAVVAVAVFVSVVLLLVTTGGVSSALSSATSVSAAGEWAMFQRDPKHTGFSPGPAPEIQRVVQWQRVVQARLVADPVVAGGVVYAGSGDKRLLALDVDSGELLWEADLGGILIESPALAGDMIYVGLSNGFLLGIDRATGQRRWAFRTGGPIFSAPVVKDGLVYVGNGNGIFVAVDAITGKKIWDFEINAWISSSPAISDDDIVIFGARDGNIYFLEAKSGKSRLRFRVVSGVESSPVIVGDRAYVNADDGRFYVLDLNERRRLLDRQFLRVRNQLFIWNILKNPPKQRGFIGSRRLSRSAGVFATPAVAHDMLYVVSADGRLFAVDREARTVAWEFAAGRTLFTPPTVVGDTIFVGAKDGKVYAVDAATGQQRWQWQAFLNSKITTSVIVAGDSLFVTAMQERILLEQPVQVTADSPRQTEDGQPLAEGWYFRFAPSPCDPSPQLQGPFSEAEAAQTEGRREASACSVFYVLK